jgi:PAS domain S-box-containing protein
MRPSWTWSAVGAISAAALFALYVGVRTALLGSPLPFELILVAGVLLGGAAVLPTWAALRERRHMLKELADRVTALRNDPSLSALGSLSSDLGPLHSQLENLAASYRQALTNLVAQTESLEVLRWEQQQTEATLQSLVGRADAEQGRSLFRLRRGTNDARNMVARLTPTLHWMVATPALRRFLGYELRELNGRFFLDLVHPRETARLRRVFEEALATGEAHNITFRLLTRQGEERHLQMDVLTRYTQESTPLHLRCHFLDVSHRVRTDRELRRLAAALQIKAAELEQANTQLRQINRELDDFSYVVSHDLKEPLRTLEAFSNFLAQDYGHQLGPEGQEFLGHLIEASRRLGALIDDLLTLSRAGRVIASPQTFDLGATFDTVRGDLADLIQRKRAVVRAEGSLPAVAGDPPRITQLLTNLVSNGLKYNENPSPEVILGQAAGDEHEPRSDFVTLCVRDNGIGIAAQYHEQIFRLFRRLHRREDYEGTGAGLAICKKIVEAHGGRLWVKSEPGQGAAFFFSLPRSPASVPTAESTGTATAERPPRRLAGSLPKLLAL